MNPIETVLVQRDYDKNWELVGKFRDSEYCYTDEFNQDRKLESYKWITMKVYPFLMEEIHG